MARPSKTAVEAAAAQTFARLRFDSLSEKDPLRYLNERSTQYIRRLETIADEARANQMPELELKTVAFLARMSPAYRTKVDVTASQLGLLKAPDLNGFSDTDLKQLEQADENTDLSNLNDRLIKEQ